MGLGSTSVCVTGRQRPPLLALYRSDQTLHDAIIYKSMPCIESLSPLYRSCIHPLKNHCTKNISPRAHARTRVRTRARTRAQGRRKRVRWYTTWMRGSLVRDFSVSRPTFDALPFNRGDLNARTRPRILVPCYTHTHTHTHTHRGRKNLYRNQWRYRT